jgi:hypothetical protein
MQSETARLKFIELNTSLAPFFLELLNSPGFIANIGDRNVRSLNDAENYISNL